MKSTRKIGQGVPRLQKVNSEKKSMVNGQQPKSKSTVNSYDDVSWWRQLGLMTSASADMEGMTLVGDQRRMGKEHLNCKKSTLRKSQWSMVNSLSQSQWSTPMMT